MSKRECIFCRHFVKDVSINDDHEIFHGVCDCTKERKRFQDSCDEWDGIMTEEEAIKQLDWMKYRFRFSLQWEQKRALDMAIEALERTDTNECDVVSRDKVLNLVLDVCNDVMDECETVTGTCGEEVYTDVREVDAILKCNKRIRNGIRQLPSERR